MQSTIDALEAAWQRSDDLFRLVVTEHLSRRAIPLRHPFVFYIGHLPAFAWNHIAVGVLGGDPFDDRLDGLFARGIDPDDLDAAKAAQPVAWPPIASIEAYRDGIRHHLRQLWPALAEAADGAEPLARWVLPLVLEHELMHHETLLYMIAQLDPAHLRRPAQWPAVRLGGPAVEAERVRIAAGSVRLGAEHRELAFGWDNEFPSERVEVPEFALDRVPVTVGQWLGFIEAGGYSGPELWDPEDRAVGARWEHPAAWRRGAHGFEVRSPFRWHPAAEVGGWPVQVSFAEARAYCRFSGARLPTEAEMHRAATTTPAGDERAWPWGEAQVGPEHGGVDHHLGAPCPVGSHPAARSAWGIDELVGNGWEWTSTPFLPRAGFTAHLRSYPGYSSDFYDGRHFVVFGASWATAARLARRSFRNWYQRHYPYVFATFRTAQ